jgi:hypothetical protein
MAKIDYRGATRDDVLMFRLANAAPSKGAGINASALARWHAIAEHCSIAEAVAWVCMVAPGTRKG